jgi:hypothetical protein
MILAYFILSVGLCRWQDSDGNDISIYVLKTMCNDYDGLNPVIGESLQSSSPLDITFWPTHPGVDRLFHWKRIATVFFKPLLYHLCFSNRQHKYIKSNSRHLFSIL